MYTFGALRACAIGFLVLAAACNDTPPAAPLVVPVVTASVRIVNAAPGIQNVTVTRNGVTAPLAQNLNYGSSTQSCVTLPVGAAHTLTFSAGSTELASVIVDPAPSGKYTVFLTSSGATRRALVVSDLTTAAAGSNGLRFLNASSGPGDVYVTTAGGEVVPSSRVYGNIGVTALSNSEPDYIAADTARKQVRFYDVGATTGTPRAELSLFGLPASRLASVVLTDQASAGPSASFITYPC